MELTIEVKAKRTSFQELYQTLLALVPVIRKKKGLQKISINRDTKDDDVFLVFFEWEDQESLENYLRSNDGSALLGAIEVLSEKTRVRIGNNEPMDGILPLQKMREGTYRH